ncbi:PD40 domain-containing protein [bacterium]|nr:PD40 domain-containing protein [bacterium]
MIKQRFLQASLLLVAAVIPLYAQLPNGRNHPELDWNEIRTEHFRILFHQGLDSAAFRSAVLAERLYGRMAAGRGVRIRGRTPVVLIGVDDYSNGIANPLTHTLTVWTTPSVKETADSLLWLERVIGHELAHMVSFWDSRNIIGKPWELFVLGLTPMWYLEGTAQVQSEHWDVHRDLLLGIASRSNALLPLKKLDGFVGSDLVDGRLVYEQGHSLMRWLGSVYGRERVLALQREHAKSPFSFSRTLKRCLGKSQAELFRDWKAAVDSAYSQDPEPGGKASSPGERIRIPLQAVCGARHSGRGDLAVVGMEKWDEGVQRLYVRGTDGSFFNAGGPHAGAWFSWSPDGERILYSRKHRGAHGSLVDDLYFVDLRTGVEQPLTGNLRASDPAWSPDGGAIAFVRRMHDGSGLWIWDLEQGGIRPLFSPAGTGEVFSPAWSPDGCSVAFSYMDERGFRDIAVIAKEGTGFRRLTHDACDDRTPVWSPNGDEIAFCSSRSGAPGLYRMKSDGSGLTAMTCTAGGVMNPDWGADGQIRAVVFEKRDSVSAYILECRGEVPAGLKRTGPAWHSSPWFDAFGISAFRNSGSVPDPVNLKASASQADFSRENGRMQMSSSLQTEGSPPFAARSFKYSAWRSVKPHLILPFFTADDAGLQYGLIQYASDPLSRHQILAYATAGRRIHYYMNYVFAGWDPALRMSLWRNTADRGGFLGSGVRLWEMRDGAELAFSFPYNSGRSLLSNHWFSAYGRWERTSLLYPGDFSAFKSRFRPFSGNEVDFGISHSWSHARPDAGQDIHPQSGIASFEGIQAADQKWGSDINRLLLQASLALRQSMRYGLVAAARAGIIRYSGDTPIQDRKQLGGSSPVRAMSRSREGDRMIFCNLEYRIPLLRDMGLRIPLFYFERWTSALWLDGARIWGADLATYETSVRKTYREAASVMTAGAELRNRIYLAGKLPFVLRFGAGRELGRRDDWRAYLMIGGVF